MQTGLVVLLDIVYVCYTQAAFHMGPSWAPIGPELGPSWTPVGLQLGQVGSNWGPCGNAAWVVDTDILSLCSL